MIELGIHVSGELHARIQVRRTEHGSLCLRIDKEAGDVVEVFLSVEQVQALRSALAVVVEEVHAADP